ncbi:hypothetical protein EJ04DRAFT_543335 [Polyplosphaeria fusca]|uniref:Uncharacterized protein n=1 Tax=Polyplosphaeria fusca TaxID=682080 RepID=A0A9P4R125_9PLEO|nr:hypothetical protein EJ04DRAFT_543335 [Polyplosphaeria fusca]
MAIQSEDDGFLLRDGANEDREFNKGHHERDRSIDSLARTSLQASKYMTVGLLCFSIYSTVMSGLFLCVAIIGPKYGTIISERGAFSPSGATLLTAFLAKTIEISFITVYLAFIGQIITRKAVNGQSVTLASITMRSWVLQPGTLLTQWESVRKKGFTILGLLSLLATSNSLLYTTSAGALVQPQVQLPPRSHSILSGAVRTSPFNTLDMQEQCLQAWPSYGDDPDSAADTCVQIKFASQCYHTFEDYFARWSSKGLVSEQHDQTHRLPVIGSLDENTTVFPTWIERTDVEQASSKWNRIVNNVTLAIPHRGVPEAARDRRNGLLQPADLFGSGSYSIHASVPALALQGLCVNADREELAPIVYETWPQATMSEHINTAIQKDFTTNNRTVLDEIFDWQDISPDDVFTTRARPVFYKFPMPANTILNHTAGSWGRSEAYLLGRHPDPNRTDYFVCSLKMQILSTCSTRYNASASGQTLEVFCDEEHRDMAYRPHILDRPDYRDVQEWISTAFSVLNAMSLNMGVLDGNASTPRTLTSLQLQEPRLNDSLPSPAEALVSMSLCTALNLIKGVPYVDFWNYTFFNLSKAQYQTFNASIQVSQYMSGGTVAYQKGFFVVLASVFLMNVLILAYFATVTRLRFITDICEPVVLFLLGYQSTPENLFRKDDGSKLGKALYSVPWLVKSRDECLVVVGKHQADGLDGHELSPWISRS